MYVYLEHPLPAQGTHVRLEKLTYAVTGACNVSLLMRRGNPVRQKEKETLVDERDRTWPCLQNVYLPAISALITINVPLFKKLRDIIFFGGENHFMSHF